MRARRRPLTVAGVVLVVVVVVLCGAVVYFVHIHGATGDWWPKAIPTTVQYNGRDYSCGPAGHRNVTRPDLEGTRPVGHTIGGGTIYARPGTSPFGVIVSGDGIFRSCSLSGGP
jgi:hypothetical protein